MSVSRIVPIQVPALAYVMVFETIAAIPLLLLMQQATEVHLVRVTTDEGEVQVWLAATSREEAVDRVLDEIPEGWAASIVQRQLPAEHVLTLNMRLGEVRRHQLS
ncbi:hypothetical protein ABIF38_006608 [Bradyrhizobium japonicum]|jgi:hypothetical protein|uniref:hypothetical protein n=1 Tax=Bradyrhizobium TaxID=374 RepID=UPI001FCEC5EE|nr:hypothetical protein [Bradyrhizobium elkanii]MCP1731084.1 hypothetical protein [Bradyrhizobium elkanii]MCP1969851.1 hypothetical protein [Bradyrhizobium elkanii]MCS3517016.1 hypothetical protein [Bradyrhizobium elkanii]MCS3575213.1 hypothetical protein [Bradyrhizobium elkanii]MCS3592096.1 hypothetical protein [Bradyrhizobium elkanii]